MLPPVVSVAVASQNPTKIRAVTGAFSRVFPDTGFLCEGYKVLSGVADQPGTIDETMHGAENRLAELTASAPDASWWVSIEGGIDDTGERMYAFACIVISDGKRTGHSMTGKFVLPNAVADLVRQGNELGIADDIVFARRDSKRANGAVGLLTGDVITRTGLYEHAVILALIPFINPDLYPKSTAQVYANP